LHAQAPLVVAGVAGQGSIGRWASVVVLPGSDLVDACEQASTDRDGAVYGSPGGTHNGMQNGGPNRTQHDDVEVS
jgi:hypothetical protein